MFNWFKKVTATESNSTAEEEASAQRRGADHKNRGDDCLKAGAFDVATGHYRQAIAAYPCFADAHSALGDTLREQGKHDEAILCYRRALEFDAELVDAHYGLGVILLENKADLQNAAVCFETTLRLKPDFIRANTALGFTFMQSGRTAEAIACFQKTIRFEPDNGMALHMIASLTGSNPPHPPRQYVEKLFDGFANTFDAHLRNLQYEVVREVKRLLRPGGFFAFSVEALEASLTVAARQSVKLEYQLQKNPSCRYAHSSEYISRLAFDNNLQLRALKTAHVRKSQGTSIHGFHYVRHSWGAR